MGTLVYLDIDDEITTAATRIREAASDEVVLVVPAGSRIATSRMNFRLLARAAQEQRRSLAIVGPDPATRSMAEAAGLTAYATVGQYEEASGEGTLHEGPEQPVPAAPAAPPDKPATETRATPATRRRRTTAAAGAAALGAAAGTDVESGSQVATDGGSGPEVGTGAKSEPAAGTGAPASGGTFASGSVSEGTEAGAATSETTAAVEDVSPGTSLRATASVAEAEAEVEARPATLPVRGGVRSTGSGVSARTIAAVVISVLVGLAGLLAVVFVLPSASITITPRTTVVGPVAVEVRADPAATEVDVEAAIVPALRPEIPLSASASFEATGKKVDETKATGTVTFTSKDPTQTNRIPGGSVVGTSGGIGFRTLAAVTVPKAKIEGLTIIPGRINVRVEAVKAGPEGNVAANAITIIPAGEDPVLTAVTNAAATDGGTRTETTRITTADVTAALETLTTQLNEQFAAAIADPAVVPPPNVAYPETARLTEPVPSVDPDSLVGQEVETFDLALTASGAVTVVDSSLVEDVTEARVLAAASPDADLVAGSLTIEVGTPVADDVAVLFPTTGQAEETARLDPEMIKEEALGKSVEEASSDLSRYGEVVITTWPDWVTSVPGFGARVEVTITTQTGEPEKTPVPAASPSNAPVTPAETTQ